MNLLTLSGLYREAKRWYVNDRANRRYKRLLKRLRVRKIRREGKNV